MERHKEICECIFCSSKCPKCQSININVDFDLKCSYNNGDVDSISINLGDVENLRLYCEDCDYDSDMDEDEELISKLINAIEDSLPKGWDCDWRDGEVHFSANHSKIISVEEDNS